MACASYEIASPKETKETSVSKEQSVSSPLTLADEDIKLSAGGHDSQQKHLKSSNGVLNSTTQLPLEPQQSHTSGYPDANTGFKLGSQGPNPYREQFLQETGVNDVGEMGDLDSDPSTPPPQYDEQFTASDGAMNWINQGNGTHNSRLGGNHNFRISLLRSPQCRSGPTSMPYSRKAPLSGEDRPIWSNGYGSSYNGHAQGKGPMDSTRHRLSILAAAKVTHRQALGQIAVIGSLYDARKDQILPQSVFLEPLSKNAVCRDRVLSKQCEIRKSGSLMETFEQLGLSPELGLSYLTGTGPYTAKGSAGHLAQKRTSDAAQEVSVVCNEVTMHDTLDLGTEELQEIVDEEIIQAEEATHVVTGIWWGTRTAITSIASPVCSIPDAKAKEAQLDSQERVVEYLGQLLTGKVTTAYTAFKEISKSLTFRVNADIDPNKQSARISDFDGVCDFIGEIPGTLKRTRAESGIRIMYDLVPIKDFAQIMNLELEREVQIVQPTDHEYQNRALCLFDKLYAARANLNSYLQALSQHELSVPKQHIETANTNSLRLNDLEDKLKSELCQDLSRARDPSFKGRLKLNSPEWEADIQEFESLTLQYAAKMTFESEITALGIKYMHPNNTETAYSEHESDIYTLYYSDAAMVAPSWKEHYTKFMELACAKNTEQLVYVVDCDFEAGQELRVPRIELRENGEIVAKDFVAEQKNFAGKCFVHPATLADMEKLPDKLLDSIRRSVKIRCPCAAATTGDCFCRVCKRAIFYLKDDDYIYCNCGRYRPANAAFKCLDPAHGVSYLKYEDSEMLLEAYDYQEFEQHNILILGETGVGKSTFINGFMNYMLFETLDKALETPDLHWAIPSSFKYTEMNNKKLDTFTVTVGEETKAQRYSLDGESATRSCVIYVLHMNGLTLRLIDTPGIGDTRGLQQDKKNVKGILQTLKSVEKISTVLFLIKPNLSRLGQVFNFCMTELLSHLHKETNQNIVFGFTNSRSTNYSLGDTGIPLQKLLTDKKTDITIGYDNTFFFDSEGFRYLAAYKTINKEMKERTNFETSFRNSAEEARRLVNKTIRMVAHEVRKTLSLSDTRLYIEGLKTPMILINKIADEDQEEIEKHKSHITEFGMSNSALEDKLKMTIRKPVKKMLPSPRTVCTDNECRTVNRDAAGKEHVVYRQICHDHCYIKTTNELIGAPEISTCEAFDYSSKPCRECGHEWDKHQHISYNLTVEEVKVDDPNILKIYNSNKSKLEKAEEAIKSLSRKKELLGERKEFINHSLASFGAYLSSTAMVKYNDATITYLDYLIDNAKKEGSVDSQRQLEEQRRIYKEQYDEMTKGNPKLDLPPKVPSYAEIMDIIVQLDEIEVNGSRIKDLVEEKMNNPPPYCNSVTLSLETASKEIDSFAWIEQPHPRSSCAHSSTREKKQRKKARSLSQTPRTEMTKVESMPKDENFLS